MLADFFNNALSAIGALLVAGGGGALVAWWLLKTYAEGWLNAKFGAQLQATQHAQEREIERLRFRINSMFDRKTKLHQREFEIVPDAWSKLVDAIVHFTNLPPQFSLKLFFQTCFSGPQKNVIMFLTEGNRKFQKRAHPILVSSGER